VDIAANYSCTSDDDAEALFAFIDQHGVMKWRPRRTKRERLDGTTYWVLRKTRSSGRTIILYHKSPTVIRLEISYRGSRAVRRAGLNTIALIRECNPGALIQRNLKLIELTPNYKKKVIRNTVKADRERHLRRGGNTTNSRRDDTYRANKASRAATMLDKFLMEEWLHRDRKRKGTRRVEWATAYLPDRIVAPVVSDYSGINRIVSDENRIRVEA
jgi:hypothetical protein